MGRINSCLLSSSGQFTGKPLLVKEFCRAAPQQRLLSRTLSVVLFLESGSADREKHQVSIAGISNALARIAWHYHNVSRCNVAGGVRPHFNEARTREDYIALGRVAKTVPFRLLPLLDSCPRYRSLLVVSGVGRLDNVAAFLEIVFGVGIMLLNHRLLVRRG